MYLIYIKREGFLDKHVQCICLKILNGINLRSQFFAVLIHWWRSLTGNHKRLVLLSKCILWLIHYFIEGEQDREVQLSKMLGLYCMFNCCYIFLNIEDLREEWFLNPSCTECQVYPYKTIQKMNLLYSSFLIFNVSLVRIEFFGSIFF